MKKDINRVIRDVGDNFRLIWAKARIHLLPLSLTNSINIANLDIAVVGTAFNVFIHDEVWAEIPPLNLTARADALRISWIYASLVIIGNGFLVFF